MEIGNVVYFDDEIELQDGKVDRKENRHCVVVAKHLSDDKSYLFCVPITTNLNVFNNANGNNVLIPEPIYNYRKMCFGMIDRLIMKEESLAHFANKTLTQSTVELIRKKALEYPSDSDIYQIIRGLFVIETVEKKKKKKKKSYKEQKVFVKVES